MEFPKASYICGCGYKTKLIGRSEATDLEKTVNENMKEIERFRTAQSALEKEIRGCEDSTSIPIDRLSLEEKAVMDSRSVYVGNVDYGTTAGELATYFHDCGPVNRVTILTDKFTGHPKGFAYVEFADKESAQSAITLDKTLFHGRQIKVCPKRTNRPGMSTTDRPPRGRAGRRDRLIVQYVYANDFRNGGALPVKFGS